MMMTERESVYSGFPKHQANQGQQLVQYDIERDKYEGDTEFIRTQLETHLKERFNVLVSKVEYGIINGHLVRQGTTEPFINSIKRGRDYIKELDPNPVDLDRENAEVEGFENVIDPFLSNPQTPLGSKVLSISPRGEEGSRYKHNFYDIFSLHRKNGQRYVEITRYSSALMPEDYAMILPGLDPQNPPSPAYFLRNPIPITDVFITSQQIHEALHKEHEYMSLSQFEEIWSSRAVEDRVTAYLFRRDAKTFDAVLNCADDVWEQIKRKKNGEEYVDFEYLSPTADMIRDWESREVRQTAGGCPGRSGAQENLPWSAAEFGMESDKYGERTFKCPECGEINIRPKDKLLKNCQHCGTDKVAC